MRAALAGARLVLANSAAIEATARDLGARATRVVHLGTDLPAERADGGTALVTVAHLVARKRHADVLRALWLLRDSHPALAWIVVGDGPERPELERLAAELGLSGRLHFTGQLPHAEAVATARRGALFVLPSVDEAFGVAYVEAMAAGVPAIGSLRRARPGGDRGGGRRDPPRRARRPRGARGRAARAARRAALAPRAGPRGARDRRGRLHLAALRRGDRRRLRGGAAVSSKPVLFVTNHAPPFRVGAFRGAARARGRRVRADRRRRAPRRRTRPGGRVPCGIARGEPAACGCRSRSCGRASAGWRGWPPPGASAP